MQQQITCMLPALPQAARRAEEAQREQARREAQARAEAELAERAEYYRRRQMQKEAELEERSAEMADLRAMKQRERQMRAAYARWGLLAGWCSWTDADCVLDEQSSAACNASPAACCPC